MPEFSPRVTAALEAYRARLAEAGTPFGDDPEHAEEHAMEDALKAADAVAFSRENLDPAAAALWDSAKPVQVGVRPPWAVVRDDPDWHPGVTQTLNDVKTVVKTLWALR